MESANIAVTGSRNWIDVKSLINTIDAGVASYLQQGYKEINLLVGDCPTGADVIAKNHFGLVHAQYGKVITFVADWPNLGGSAGPARNKKMLDYGCDALIACVENCVKPGCPRKPSPHVTHGTASTIKFASQKGLRIVEIHENIDEFYFDNSPYGGKYLVDLLLRSKNVQIFLNKYPEYRS